MKLINKVKWKIRRVLKYLNSYSTINKLLYERKNLRKIIISQHNLICTVNGGNSKELIEKDLKKYHDEMNKDNYFLGNLQTDFIFGEEDFKKYGLDELDKIIFNELTQNMLK